MSVPLGKSTRMGNALRADTNGAMEIRASLQARASHPSEVVREHVAWALGG